MPSQESSGAQLPGRATLWARAAPTEHAAGRPRVLLVDNDPGVTQVIEAMLQEHELEVHCVGTAEAGLEQLEAMPPTGQAGSRAGAAGYRLVILDLRMPGIGGIGFLEAVRGRAVPPIIVLSGYVSAEDRRRIEAHGGVRGVFEKPFDLIELTAQVLHLVEAGSPGVQVPGSEA